MKPTGTKPGWRPEPDHTDWRPEGRHLGTGCPWHCGHPHRDSLVPAKHPHRARGSRLGSSVGAPSFTYPARVSSSLRHTCEANGGQGWVQQSPTSDPWGPGAGAEAEEARLTGAEPPNSIRTGAAWQASRSKNTTKPKKQTWETDTKKRHPQVKGHQKHQHVTQHKTSPGTDTPRHRQETEAGRAEE